MKKRRSGLIQLGILLVLGLAVILTLVVPQLSAGRRRGELLELSVIIRETDSSLWLNARLGMEQAAGEMGAELRFLTLTAANDAQEQAQLLSREAEGGADALIVVPAHPAELAPQLRELTGQRPVVAMESPLEGAQCTVTPDNEAMGQALAQAVIEDWKGGTVLLLDTGAASAGVSARLEAALATLAAAGVPVERRISEVGALASVLSAQAQETRAVQIMAFEPAATESAAQAKESQSLYQPLYGVGVTANTAAALERGTVAAVAAWSDYAAGYLAVEGAVRAVQSGECGTQPLPFFLVRGEDIYDPDNQKLLFPVTS